MPVEKLDPEYHSVLFAFSRFNRTLTFDRQTDGHQAIAYIVLAYLNIAQIDFRNCHTIGNVNRTHQEMR